MILCYYLLSMVLRVLWSSRSIRLTYSRHTAALVPWYAPDHILFLYVGSYVNYMDGGHVQTRVQRTHKYLINNRLCHTFCTSSAFIGNTAVWAVSVCVPWYAPQQSSPSTRGSRSTALSLLYHVDYCKNPSHVSCDGQGRVHSCTCSCYRRYYAK